MIIIMHNNTKTDKYEKEIIIFNYRLPHSYRTCDRTGLLPSGVFGHVADTVLQNHRFRERSRET